MPTLDSISGTLKILDKYGFKFNKRFGQNFLIDANILDKIVTGALITKDDTVLEIGPGIGTLTQYLCERAKKVIAVEIDKTLIPILDDTLSEYDNVTVINEDILKVDINALVRDHNEGRPIKVVANLPYYITTPIIMGLFESDAEIESMTVMIQKEVADRIKTGPGSKDYGALSLAVQFYSKPEVIANVSPECFIPKPNVGSSVIRLSRYETKPVDVKDYRFMFRVIKAAFSQRRKTLANCLSSCKEFGIDRETAAGYLEKMGLNKDIRGEKLTLEQFAVLSDIMIKGLEV
ncbi:MAG: 16S rRNA (adenine(1518)-N(6)/adenine(1519)-N(6))-dimethyltransferase RsmA [Lachnospiraceae bacterium]|nr:16S rRNA (adenine(1518)-N(6)/adenine(1519)-N(6))-dimethyltransferase RsmA [Lachnospiraceae bacterium]